MSRNICTAVVLAKHGYVCGLFATSQVVVILTVLMSGCNAILLCTHHLAVPRSSSEQIKACLVTEEACRLSVVLNSAFFAQQTHAGSAKGVNSEVKSESLIGLQLKLCTTAYRERGMAAAALMSKCWAVWVM